MRSEKTRFGHLPLNPSHPRRARRTSGSPSRRTDAASAVMEHSPPLDEQKGIESTWPPWSVRATM